jgi:hypothetical protein
MLRRSLFAAAAFAPLWLATAAAAQTTVSSASTTPLATSGVGDVTVAAGATITSPNTTPAVTLDSNAVVTNSGGLAVVNNTSDATGVLIRGGTTGAYTGAGTITITEDYAATDTANSDGVVEAPFAQGSGRYGIRLVGPGAFTGDINATGATAVKGNDSAGISLETTLAGSLTTGSISVTGDRSTGVRIASPVGGGVVIGGGVSATGAGAKALDLTGDVTGQLRIYGGVTATGFSTTVRSTDATALGKIQATAADVQLSGSAVTIGADVLGGVFLAAPPAGTTSDTTADLDGDGVADGTEGTAAIASYSNAPALLVGSATRNVTLGAFGSADLANNYGLVSRGSIAASGVYDGFSATAVQFGGLGGAVNLAGGARFVGSVSAVAYGADATGVLVGAGATLPELRLEGSTGAAITSNAANVANAVRIDAGASVSYLTNSGTIGANATGPTASATAVLDRSGTLATVLNSGVISAGVGPTTTGGTATGASVALDLSANTTGVTLTQYNNGAGTTPAIVGEVRLGAGPNVVNLLGGSMTGALDLGGGASTLIVDNGASYKGALTYGGSSLALDVRNGSFRNDRAATYRLSSLNVGAAGTLIVAVDPAQNTATRYDVSGAATLASGAKIGVTLASLLNATQTYTIVSSPTLSVGGTDTSLLDQTPYLYAATLGTNAAAGALTLTLRRRTAAELGLTGARNSAFDAIYRSLPNDTGVQTALLGQTTASGLTAALDQLIPQHAGGQFRVGQIAAEAIARTTAEADHVRDAYRYGGPWVQEVVFGLTKSRTDTNAYRGFGYGFAGGWEADTAGFGVVGLSAAFITSRLTDPDLTGDNHLSSTSLEGGVYWRGEIGGLRLDARFAGGGVQFQSGREAIIDTTIEGVAAVVNRKNKANWNGYTLSGRFGAGYEIALGSLFLRPQARIDYYRLHEAAYAEKFGGDGFDLTFAARNNTATTASASLVAGADIGATGGLHWRPQLEVGWRKTLSGGPADTVARFAGGDNFTLSAEDARKGGALARIGLKADSDYFELMLEGGGEIQGKVKSADLRVAARILF